MRTTNLYKIVWFNEDAPGPIISGATDVLWVGARTYDDVLRIIKRQNIKDEDIRSIEFERTGVVLDDCDECIQIGIA